MTQEITDLFKNNSFTLILSSITEDVYIDKSGACYFFDNRHEAEEFTKYRENTKLNAKPGNYQYLQNYIDTLYQKGVAKIKIKLYTSSNFIIYTIEKEDVKENKYQTHDVCFNVSLLQQTRLIDYAMAFKSLDFLTPVDMPMREFGKYPEITYRVIKYKDAQYNIIFSTLTEFEKWCETQSQKFKPLKIRFKEINKIRGHNGVILNPLSSRIVLTDDLIKKINAKDKKEKK